MFKLMILMNSVLAAVIAGAVGFGFMTGLLGLLGGIIVIVILVVNAMLTMVFVKGAAAALIEARMRGGLVLGIVRRDRQMRFDRFYPKAGMVRTKQHGAYTIMPEGVYSADGIPMAIAPEKVGFNVRIEHVAFMNKMKEMGIHDVSEIADVDQYGHVIGWKDDPRVEELKEGVKIEPWTVVFDDVYKYLEEASNPIHQDTNIQLGISQGLLGQAVQKWGWLIFLGVAVLFVCIGLYVLMSYTSSGEQVIRVIVDESGGVTPIIEAMIPFVP